MRSRKAEDHYVSRKCAERGEFQAFKLEMTALEAAFRSLMNLIIEKMGKNVFKNPGPAQEELAQILVRNAPLIS